jgi:hypothetical protein
MSDVMEKKNLNFLKNIFPSQIQTCSKNLKHLHGKPHQSHVLGDEPIKSTLKHSCQT